MLTLHLPILKRAYRCRHTSAPRPRSPLPPSPSALPPRSLPPLPLSLPASPPTHTNNRRKDAGTNLMEILLGLLLALAIVLPSNAVDELVVWTADAVVPTSVWDATVTRTVPLIKQGDDQIFTATLTPVSSKPKPTTPTPTTRNVTVKRSRAGRDSEPSRGAKRTRTSDSSNPGRRAGSTRTGGGPEVASTPPAKKGKKPCRVPFLRGRVHQAGDGPCEIRAFIILPISHDLPPHARKRVADLVPPTRIREYSVKEYLLFWTAYLTLEEVGVLKQKHMPVRSNPALLVCRTAVTSQS